MVTKIRYGNTNTFLVGDLEPLEYLEAYEDNAMLKHDWDTLLAAHPRRIFYAHANEKELE